MASASSHRRILWATSLIGGASFAAMAIGLVRNKVIAVVGGPEAMGLLGVFTTLIALGGAFAAFGLDTSAVKMLAGESGNPSKVRAVRKALRLLVWSLASIAALLFFLFGRQIASLVFGDPTHSNDVCILGIGAAATACSAVQVAVIQSSGALGSLAKLRVIGAAAGTAISVAAVLAFGVNGILIAALAVPLMSLAVSTWFTPDIPRAPSREPIGNAARELLSVGGVVMVAYITSNLTNLAERSIVFRELGAGDAGQFHACSAILWVNLSLVLNAMAADYYPRLAQAPQNELEETVNRQLHVLIVMAAPAFVVLSVAAPLALDLLYSVEFAPSAFLLRLFVVAGVLRLPIFVFGYLLLARRGGREFWFGELAGAGMLPVVWLLATRFGLTGVGVGVIVVATATFATYTMLARSCGVHLTRQNSTQLSALAALLVVIAMLFTVDTKVAVVVGVASAFLIAVRSVGEIRALWAT